MKRLLFVAVAGALFACSPPPAVESAPLTPVAPAASVEPFRLSAPAPLPDVAFVVPRTRAFELGNGIRVRTLSQSGPFCALRIRLMTSPDQPRAAVELLAAELTRGSSSHMGLRMHQAFGKLNARFEVVTGGESIDLVSTSPPDGTDSLVALLTEVLTSPGFTAESLASQEEYMASYRESWARRPSNQAWAAASRVLFGAKHPYGHPSATADELRTTRFDEVKGVFKSLVTPQRMLVSAAGACDQVSLRPTLEQHLGRLSGAGTVPVAVAPPPPLAGRRLVIVDTPGTPQVEVMLAYPGPAGRSPDWTVGLVATQMMEEEAQSRMKEQLSLTDNVSVSASGYTAGGLVTARAFVRTDKLTQTLEELEALPNVLLRAQEPQVLPARSYVLLQDLGSYERARDIALSLSVLAALGSDVDALATYRGRISAIDADAVRGYARRYLGQGVIVLVGDRRQLVPMIQGSAWKSVEQVEP